MIMGVLTEEQLKEVWERGGMKFNMRRFHAYLTERGLMPYINVNKFSNHVYDLLNKFFVQGLKEFPDGRQQLPAQARWGDVGNGEGEGEAEAPSGRGSTSSDA